MMFIPRLLAVLVFAVAIFVFGCGYCLLSPRNPKHVYTFGRLFGKLHKLFGIKLDLRLPENAHDFGPCVFIANHQSNWDLVTISNAVTPGAVTVGKKSLKWLPVFGQLYWLTGNIMIDRNNRSRAIGTIGQVIDKIKEDKVSVWLFPEGTRSRGRGLLPFKTGAFHAAVGAGVPIVPIVCSSTAGLKAGKWDNGHVIVEMLEPISTEGYGKDGIRELSKKCHDLMQAKLAELDEEVARLNGAEKQTA